jgi:hypothetical protein
MKMFYNIKIGAHHKKGKHITEKKQRGIICTPLFLFQNYI